MATVSRESCTCDICQSYCRHVPGWFTPDEINKAARLLKLSPAQFFKKHLTVDYWSSRHVIFTLRPKTVKETGGDVSMQDPRGRCHFYRHGRCQIHEAKPHECATAIHSRDLPKDWHHRTALTWKGQRHQSRIARLLGRAPEMASESFLDTLSLLSGWF